MLQKTILISCGLAIAFFAIQTQISAADKAADTKPAAPAAKKPAKPDPLMQIEDTPGLPRVLIIGDSISMGYTLPVRELLKGKANVHRPAENCHSSREGKDMLAGWLKVGGDKKWDVIHFNFGLHDLKYLNSDGKMVAIKPGSTAEAQGLKQNVSLDDYEKNIRSIVDQLKKTGAKLIWRTTTPVPEGAGGRPGGEEKKYNEVAKKIMDENKIEIQDLNDLIKEHPKYQRKANVHFYDEGSKAMAEKIVVVIEKSLPKK